MNRPDWVMFCTAVVVWGSAGCGPSTPPSPPTSVVRPVAAHAPKVRQGKAWFRNVTSESGLEFSYRNGEEADQYTILESLGGGVGLLDYDGDGLLDVFVTGGGFFNGPEKTQIQGHPCKLYRNRGDFKFSDVSEETGLANVPWWYTHGAAVADYDRDGWPDLLVTGFGRIGLLHNEQGEGELRRFVDVTAQVGLDDSSWSTSAAWGDVDGDGFPDLYVCHYLDWSFDNHVFCPGKIPGVQREVCTPTSFKPLRHAIFHNEQGHAFRADAGKHELQATGCGLGVLMADLNDDTRPDVFVTNDLTPNHLFFNRNGKLEERATPAGVALDERGLANANMGIDVGDYDASGRPSIWITVFQNEIPVLARNLGNELFLHQSRAAGIGALGQNFVSFGTGFIDVDNDGWEDLVIANGHVFRKPPGGDPKQRPVLLHNVERRERRFFEDASIDAGPYFETPTLGRGLAIGDLDNDGWPDVVVSELNSPVTLLRNETARSISTPRNWLGVKLVGRKRRDVTGSTVVVESRSRRLSRFKKGGGGYLSANDPRLLFGLGEHDGVVRVTVKWAWGESQQWDSLKPGSYWVLSEGQSQANGTETE